MSADPRPDWVLTRRREIGHHIARLRLARGLTIDALADRTGLDRKTIMRVEAGRRWARLDVLLLLASGLGVRPGVLLDTAEGPAAGPQTTGGGV